IGSASVSRRFVTWRSAACRRYVAACCKAWQRGFGDVILRAHEEFEFARIATLAPSEELRSHDGDWVGESKIRAREEFQFARIATLAPSEELRSHDGDWVRESKNRAR